MWETCPQKAIPSSASVPVSQCFIYPSLSKWLVSSWKKRSRNFVRGLECIPISEKYRSSVESSQAIPILGENGPSSIIESVALPPVELITL